MTTELKPCPNPECSHVHPPEIDDSSIHGGPGSGLYIWCPNCRLRGPTGYSTLAHLRLWDALPREAEPAKPERKCPYCGSKVSGIDVASHPTDRRQLDCEGDCAAQSPVGDTDDEAYAAWWEPFEAKSECAPQSQEDDHLCIWCRQECKMHGARRWWWACTNEDCVMCGPSCTSKRKAWKSLERMNKRQVQR